MEIGMLGLRFSVARIVLVALAAVPIGYLLEWVMGIGADETRRSA
jgi:membrane protein YqaA with SNARE-associated domain